MVVYLVPTKQYEQFYIVNITSSAYSMYSNNHPFLPYAINHLYL